MRSIKLFMIVIVCLTAGFMISSTVSAQYWQAMPPYNVLWPLWPDVLSPNVSGVPTPLVSSLTRTTQLPVMPAFVWDIGPSNIYGHPYFLYNAPASLGGGLFYYDQITGFNTFPPADYLLPDGDIYVNPHPDVVASFKEKDKTQRAIKALKPHVAPETYTKDGTRIT